MRFLITSVAGGGAGPDHRLEAVGGAGAARVGAEDRQGDPRLPVGGEALAAVGWRAGDAGRVDQIVTDPARGRFAVASVLRVRMIPSAISPHSASIFGNTADR